MTNIVKPYKFFHAVLYPIKALGERGTISISLSLSHTHIKQSHLTGISPYLGVLGRAGGEFGRILRIIAVDKILQY